jgi:hypothetical protein
VGLKPHANPKCTYIRDAPKSGMYLSFVKALKLPV